MSIITYQLPEGVPPLTQYYIYLTAGCNLACRHCWISPTYQPNGGSGGHLDFGLFRIAIDDGIPLGLGSVKLTGGEPLLHPDFKKIVDYIAEKELNLTIETNGTLLTDDLALYLKTNGSLRHISISLDGATASTHDRFRGVKGSFEKAINGIRALSAVGYHPQIIMSLHQGNFHEIEALIHIAEELGAGSVKFNLIQSTGRGEKMSQQGQTLEIKNLVELGNWIENDLQKKVSIGLYYSWPMAFYSINHLLTSPSETCGIFNILGILASGQLAMCGIGVEDPELCYGTLGKDKLFDIWCNHPTLKSLRLELPKNLKGVCGSCLFKNQCLGCCVAQNYHQAHSLDEPFWFCAAASEANLYPLSRLKEGSKVPE